MKILTLRLPDDLYDKILSLFEKFLDEHEVEIVQIIQANWNNNSDYMGKQILQNIKNKLRGEK